MTATEYLKRHAGMVSYRQTNWDSHFQDIARFIHPGRANFNVRRQPGEKRNTQLYDDIGVFANSLLASALHGMLTNPATKWFSLQADEQARPYFELIENVLYKALAASNYSEAMNEMYLDLGAFGTAGMFVDYDFADDNLVFMARPLSEIYVAESNRGTIDTVSREFTFTAQQAYQEWGEALHAEIRKCLSDGKHDREFTFVHLVCPNLDKGRPFKSVYIDKQHKEIVEEGGYNEFPYMVPRWAKRTGERYGAGPGLNALTSMKMLNEMCKTTIRSAQKEVDPSVWLPNDGYIRDYQSGPGRVNYYDATGGRSFRDYVGSLKGNGNIGLGLEMEDRRREAVMRHFYVDQFNLPERADMTATEVMQRTQEKLRLMGPMLGRVQAELLNPLIKRCIGLLMRAGRIPRPPEEAGEFEIRIESQVARAQRAEEATSVLAAIGDLAPLLQAQPEALGIFKIEETARGVAELRGDPSKWVASEEEFAAIMEQAAQARQQQMELAAGEQIAGAVGKIK